MLINRNARHVYFDFEGQFGMLLVEIGLITMISEWKMKISHSKGWSDAISSRGWYKRTCVKCTIMKFELLIHFSAALCVLSLFTYKYFVCFVNFKNNYYFRSLSLSSQSVIFSTLACCVSVSHAISFYSILYSLYHANAYRYQFLLFLLLHW